MLEVHNTKVYDLKESVIACRNAMRLTMPEYTEEEFKESLKRAVKLVQASKNSEVKCHDNFLTGIRVSFDLKYPGYISPELQRYHFFDIVTSMSKMHMLTKMDMDYCFNEYVTEESKEQMKRLVAEYNEATTEDKRYEAFMRLLSNCPFGIELVMRCSTNYKQLQTIYHQRKNHKLREDYGAFCAWIETLPFAHPFIIGDETDITNSSYE